MTSGSLRKTFLCIAAGCLLAPGLAAGNGGGKGCSLLGTWFGVDPATHTLTGWMVSVTGQSENAGTNNLEYPTFDPTLGGAFPAVRISTDRGVWKRTGGNTFVYSFMGIAVDNANLPVWIGRVTGNIVLIEGCRTERITASLDVFYPTDNPFEDSPRFTIPLPDHYGYRYEIP